MSADTSMSEYQDFTVTEFAETFDINIDTVRSRIRLGKYNVVPVIRDGKSYKGIRVSKEVTVNKLLNNSQNDSQLTAKNYHPDSHLTVKNLVDDQAHKDLISLYEKQLADLRELNQRLELTVTEKANTVETVKEALKQAEIRTVSLEGDLKAANSVLNEKDRLLAEKDNLVAAHLELIESQKVANEALNNERVVITQQLQKYRSNRTNAENYQDKKPFWKFW